MRPSTLVATLLAMSTTIAAQRSGPLLSGPGLEELGAQNISTAAGRNPNSTSSVTFSRISNNTAEEWTWRINITDLAVSNNSLANLGEDDADYSEGLRIVNTQWELDWPGENEDETFGEWMAARQWDGVRILATIMNMPANITEQTATADGGDCSPFLGEQCTASLMQAADVYMGSGQVFSNLDGCSDTFSGGGVGFDIPAGSNSPAYQRGETLYYFASASYPAGTTELTEQINLAESALQILIMNPQYENPGLITPVGPLDRALVFCQVVNPETAQNDSDGEDSGVETEENFATQGWSLSVKSGLAAVVLSTLALNCF